MRLLSLYFYREQKRKLFSSGSSVWNKSFSFASVLSSQIQLQMKHLTSEQRYTIKSLLGLGLSQKKIAETIHVDKSTLSRELVRNCDKRSGLYDCDLAQRKYEHRKRGKPTKCILTPEMSTRAKEYLKKDWSPEQITHRCKLQGESMVSHETLYRWIWADKKRGGDLHTYLRRQGRKYTKRGSVTGSRGHIPNRVDIDQRPEEVNLKRRFGDLEIDTVIGKNHQGALVTINDRLTRTVWIRKLDGKEAIPLMIKTIEALMPYKPLIHTITADNGKEFAKHEQIAEELDIDFYFCKPYHSWERGANENTNGLIRQYIPKGSSFEGLTDEYVAWVENQLNNRPRKSIGYLTPNEKLKQVLTRELVAFTC